MGLRLAPIQMSHDQPSGAGLSALAPIRICLFISKQRSKPVPFRAKATARSGPGFGTKASVRRRGADVFKALALGATLVGCRRLVLYGVTLGGMEGAQSVLEYMRDNLTLVMRLAGASKIADINREFLTPLKKA